MAVDALELRPRSAVAIFDAALRVCATSSGVWALTLPAGAALVAALFNLAEAISQHQPLAGPVALWTAAWVFRAVSQGAACHFLEAQVLGRDEPSTWVSFLAALRHAPSLIIASAYLAVLNLALWVLTGGVGLLFLGAHQAGYAAVMRGQGHPLALYGTCAKLLGAARHSAAWVRLCGATQAVVAVNLHLGVALGLSSGAQLMGLDLTFVDRFASLDNPVWLATIAVVTFSLFEPIRAATATLLLIDGRVRQEGLDLLASVEQLPTRRKSKSALGAATLALALLLPAAASAQDTAALRGRVERLGSECGLDELVTPEALEDVSALGGKEQSALARFVSRVERLAFDQEDCDAAEQQLRSGLDQLHAARLAEAEANAAAARTEVKAILSRPEFRSVPDVDRPGPKADQAPPEPGWFQRLLDRFLEWLKALLNRKDDSAPPPPTPPGLDGPMAGANLVMFAVIALMLGVLIAVLVRGWPKKPDVGAGGETGGLEVGPLSSDPQSALFRTPETWAGLADELAARGEHREAIRHLYLALLSRLHRDGVIDYDPTSSNWDYLLGFKGSASTRGAFRELTRRFDFAWYGNLDHGAPSFRDFRGIAEPMLSAPAPGAGAHA